MATPNLVNIDTITPVISAALLPSMLAIINEFTFATNSAVTSIIFALLVVTAPASKTGVIVSILMVVVRQI